MEYVYKLLSFTAPSIDATVVRSAKVAVRTDEVAKLHTLYGNRLFETIGQDGTTVSIQ
jgi:hypothetical protein